MNPSTIEAVTRDNDLSEQARREQAAPLPGPNLRDDGVVHTGADHPGAQPQGVAVGGGAVAGAAAGAVVGTVVAGPAGAVVGGVVGAVTGALGGSAVAPAQSDHPSEAIPEPQEREVTRFGEVHQEDLRR